MIRSNFLYWHYSLQHREPIIDRYYINDNPIITDKELLRRVEDLRELITTYCVLEDLGGNNKPVLDKIFCILTSYKNINYMEFVAFWKVADYSYSVFKKNPTKDVLRYLLKEYCNRRRKLYEKAGYTNVTVQALYDVGSSRKKGLSGIKKLSDILFSYDVNVVYIQDLQEFTKEPISYFLPDSGKKGKELFYRFLEEYSVRYDFGKEREKKLPDMVLRVFSDVFIIEAKHVKESGGAQDKQINELISFIGYKEEKATQAIHYVAFMDGTYFNKFIDIPNDKVKGKVYEQKKAIEGNLKRYPSNFFVNTAGIRLLFEDLLAKGELVNRRLY